MAGASPQKFLYLVASAIGNYNGKTVSVHVAMNAGTDQGIKIMTGKPYPKY